MKHRIAMIALLSGVLLGLHPNNLSAQVTFDLNADIPFPFIIGNQTLPSGKYTIHSLDEQNVMELKGESGSPVVFVFNRTEAKSAPAQSELIFNKYGDQEFLSTISMAGANGGAQLETSKAEKELLSHGQKPHTHAHPAKLAHVPKKKVS